MLKPRTAAALILAAVALYAILGRSATDRAETIASNRQAVYAAAMEE